MLTFAHFTELLHTVKIIKKKCSYVMYYLLLLLVFVHVLCYFFNIVLQTVVMLMNVSHSFSGMQIRI